MSRFKNLQNGYIEDVTYRSALFVLAFGGLYLIYKELWSPLILWLILVCASSAFDPEAGILAAIVGNFVLSFSISAMMERRYLRLGWIKLEEINDDLDRSLDSSRSFFGGIVEAEDGPKNGG